MGRIKLDFSLETAEERKKFLDSYLTQFNHLSAKELETIANYLLWGKTPNGEKLGKDIQIKTKNGTWDKRQPEESLEALLEKPGFNDAVLMPISEAAPPKKTRNVFSRSKARQEAPPELLPTFEQLWQEIDRLDLVLTFYELKIGKRKNPPRPELLALFDDETQSQLRAQAEQLNQFHYLKKRHLLVDLRTQQYTLQDTYIKPIGTLPLYRYQEPQSTSIVYDVDVDVRPVGLRNGATAIFDDLNPSALSEEQLREIYRIYWKKQQPTSKPIFDFRKLEHVYQLLLNYNELKILAERQDGLEQNLGQLLDTLDFYIKKADLTEPQRRILELKRNHIYNQVIADTINKEFNKSYTANYISTIFRQKIIVKINEAAILHEKEIENCAFPENFKRCNTCGKILLLDSQNFVRKTRSLDGFNSKCKRCEREARQRRKLEKEKNNDR